MIAEKTNEAKDLLKQLKTLVDDDSSTKQYLHTDDILKISRKLESMKLKDEFLLKDLTDDENEILDWALIISNASR